MTTRFLQPLFGIIIILMGGSGWCDHALLADGHVVYNVIIPDTATTGGMLVRIRTTQASFEFDPKSNTVTTLPAHTIIKRISDYVKTTQRVGREAAVALVQEKAWHRYQPVPHEILVAPTPAPKARPIAVGSARATPIPLNVVSPEVPLQQRLDQQLDLFMTEQGTLARDAVTSAVNGLLSPDRIREIKVETVERQKMILEQYFPQNAETVNLAVKYWAEQIEKVRQTGKFDLENL